VEAGRQLFTKYGCFNCHAIGGQGAQVGPNLTGMDVRLSRDELTRFILEPPQEIPMPSYRGHITDEELERIAEFVLVSQAWPKEF
jgi:putative heme-binding domain-containing protein